MFESEDAEVHLDDTCFGTHHVNFGFDTNQHAVDQRRRFSPAGSTPAVRRDGRRPPSRKAGRRSCSTPTATASAAYVDPEPAGRSETRTSVILPGLLCRDGEPGRWLDLGYAGVFGRPGVVVVRFDPDRASRAELHVPAPGFGPRGGDIDIKGRVWVSLGSGHSASSTSASAKARSMVRRRTATRAQKAGHSSSTPARASTASATTAPRIELLHLGRSARHARPRQGRADLDRQRE